jgi:hypothetical protein
MVTMLGMAVPHADQAQLRVTKTFLGQAQGDDDLFFLRHRASMRQTNSSGGG